MLPDKPSRAPNSSLASSLALHKLALMDRRYSDYEIQQLGRWRSDAYKLYIDVPKDRILHLSTRLHWADPQAQDFESRVGQKSAERHGIHSFGPITQN
ncbi:hypothetical protein K474DRAFT_1707003 [Panus rudis PR-1116 ss-1]|nr:hypothetical protein K474DRAFT_1707003 [Panus rudis PR-1116 ss-1]